MKKKTNKVKMPQPYKAISNYLKKNGWYVVVIGGTSVQQGDLKNNFIFRCDFIGSKKE